jgi:PAS domain S-box-containing protein
MRADTAATIGFSRNFSVGVPFWTLVEHGTRKRARELGVNLIVRYSTDGPEQAAAIHSLVQQQVDAIIVAAIEPNNPAFVGALKQATGARIPIIAADVALPLPVACLVRSDDVRGAAVGATYLAERLDGHGQVVHLQGGLQSPVAQLRSAGVHQVLDRFPNIEIIAETDRGDWRGDYVLPIMREILKTYPDIRGVIAANDPMALGAINAIAEVGWLGEVVVIGVDGDPDALIALESGVLAGTVRRSPYSMGRTVVETAVDILQGAAVPAEVLLDDMNLVTGQTVARALIETIRIMPGVIDDLMENSTALATERAMLRTIIDSLPDAIYVKDRQGRFEVANRAVAQLMGARDPEELIGKTDFDFYPHEMAAQFHADEQALIQSGLPLRDKEEPVVDANGVPRWLITAKIPLRDHQNQVIRLVGRGQDITERKAAEAEQQRLQEEVIRAQALLLEELSTPLIPISNTTLVMPLIGRIDTRRASQIIETLLTGITSHQATMAIVDITGVNVVDTQVAHVLIRAAQAVKLLGAQLLLTGLRPEVAQALVSLGVDLRDIVTRSTLQDGIAYGLRRR